MDGELTFTRIEGQQIVLQRDSCNLLSGRCTEGAGTDDMDAAPFIILVKILDGLVDVSVQAELKTIYGKQLHERRSSSVCR